MWTKPQSFLGWDVTERNQTNQRKWLSGDLRDGNLASDWFMTPEKPSLCQSTLSSTFSPPAVLDTRSRRWMLTRQKKVTAAGMSWNREESHTNGVTVFTCLHRGICWFWVQIISGELHNLLKWTRVFFVVCFYTLSTDNKSSWSCWLLGDPRGWISSLTCISLRKCRNHIYTLWHFDGSSSQHLSCQAL